VAALHPNRAEWRLVTRSLTRTYVILVLPKCLLTWGYVKVDAVAFCLHPDRLGKRFLRSRHRFMQHADVSSA